MTEHRIVDARDTADPDYSARARSLAADIKAAVRAKDWDAAIAVGQQAISTSVTLPPVAHRALRKAYQAKSDWRNALSIIEPVWVNNPLDEGIADDFVDAAFAVVDPAASAEYWRQIEGRAEHLARGAAAVVAGARERLLRRRMKSALQASEGGRSDEAILQLKVLIDAFGDLATVTASADLARVRTKLFGIVERETTAAAEAGDRTRSSALAQMVESLELDAPDRAEGSLQRVAGHAASLSLAGRWGEAAALWQNLIDDLGVDAPPRAFASLSRAYRKLGKWPEATAVAEEGSGRYPDDIVLTKELAVIATARSDWPSSFRLWSRISDLRGAADREQFAKRKAAAAYLAMATSSADGLSDEDNAIVRHLGLTEETTLAVDGVLALRSTDFAKARDTWQRYWLLCADAADERAPLTVEGFQRDRGNDRWPVVKRKDGRGWPASAGQVCVYTAMFGDYDAVHPPLYKPPGVDFICFSDREIIAPGWEVRVIERPFENAGLSSRHVKVLPYEYVGNYRYSLYVDSNVQIVADLSLLFANWLDGSDFVGWRHAARSDIYDELETILIKNKHPPKGIVDQYEYFRQEGVPHHTGLIEASVLWRDHENQDVVELMRSWWAHLERFGYRDQPALAHLLWRSNVGIEVMPPEAGSLRHNGYFFRHLHHRTPFDVERAAAGGETEPAGDGTAF